MKPSVAAGVIKSMIEISQPVFVNGPPGIGKSEIVNHVSKELGLEVIDIRAVLLDPVDLRGIPYVKEGIAHWAPPAFLPRGGEGVMFLDEIANAPPMVQSALLQLVLDGKIGEYTKPKGWRFVAASNRACDRAGAHKLISSLANRFACHLAMEVDHTDWHNWALEHGIEPDIRAFMSFRPQLLSQFNPASDEPAFASPRSWFFASNIVKKIPRELHLQVLSGTVGSGPAGEYVAFRDVYMSLPNPEEVIRHPMDSKVPTDPATLYAVIGAMTEISRKYARDKNKLEPIAKYINRLPPAFIVAFYHDTQKVAPLMMSIPSCLEWVKKNKSLLL